MNEKFKKALWKIAGGILDILVIFMVCVVLLCAIYGMDVAMGKKYPYIGWVLFALWILLIRTVFYRGMISFRLRTILNQEK